MITKCGFFDITDGVAGALLIAEGELNNGFITIPNSVNLKAGRTYGVGIMGEINSLDNLIVMDRLDCHRQTDYYRWCKRKTGKSGREVK